MATVSVSQTKPEDARGTQEVFYKTWLATYPNKEQGITVEDIEHNFKDAFTDEALAKRAEMFRDPKPGHFHFIAKDGEKVVGVCRTIESEVGNKLQAIYVLPEYQGKGIGKMLWETAKTIFNPGKNIFVEVATFNTKAIEFYKKLGFTDTGRRFSEERFRMKSGAMIPEMEMVIETKK